MTAQQRAEDDLAADAAVGTIGGQRADAVLAGGRDWGHGVPVGQKAGPAWRGEYGDHLDLEEVFRREECGHPH